MRIAFSAVAAACVLALSSSVSAQGEPVTDCPLRDLPYSVESPLIDILLNPQASAIVGEAFGTDFSTMPDIVRRTDPPSFAAILTVRGAAGWAGKGEDVLAQVDEQLAGLQVTDADRVARCARYDNDVPTFDFSGDAPRILLFEKINGYRDTPSVEAAHAAFAAIAEEKGWQVASTESGGVFNAESLAGLDVVIWNNISGDVLTVAQRQALRDYVEGGGGFLAVHGSAGDPAYFWDWYADTLIGARFAGHPANPQFQEARVVVVDPAHPAAADLPAEWTMRDEWYSFRSNPRDSGSRIIATLDESTYQPSAGRPDDLSMGAEHPIAWSRIIGKGRMFYSAIGHLPETYSHPNYVAMLEDAIAWAGRIGSCDCAEQD